MIFKIILIWLCIAFLIPLFFFPNMLFSTRIDITPKVRKLAMKLKSKDKEKTLRNVFNYVDSRYTSERLKLFILLNRHFWYNVDKILDREYFLGCHVQCLVLRALLLATGQFDEKNIEKRIVMTPLGTIHQSCFVKINKKIFEADPFYEILEEVIDKPKYRWYVVYHLLKDKLKRFRVK